MFVAVLIIIVLLSGLVLLLKQSGRGMTGREGHPVLQALNFRYGKAACLLCHRQAFVSAGQEHLAAAWPEVNA